MDDEETEMDLDALGLMRRARLNFETRICEASQSTDDSVIDILRSESTFELAEFYFSLRASALQAPDPVAYMDRLIDLHNQSIERLKNNRGAVRRRGLNPDKLDAAMFTADTRPRLMQIWKDQPGALDQSNLGRFLVRQMSSEAVRTLVIACQKAGFLDRRMHPLAGVMVVASKGVMEDVFGACIREMRIAMGKLQ